MTRPSVSLVELSRRETRPSLIGVPSSPGTVQPGARQSRLWHLLGYALLLLVLVAGAAGLYLLWNQLPPQPVATPSNSPSLPALAEPSSKTPQPTGALGAAKIVTPAIAPTRPPASATPKPTLASPTSAAAPTMAATLPATPSAMSGAAHSSPTSTPSAVRLAFYSTRDEQPGIYVINVDDPEEQQTLPLPEGYDLAAWPTFCGERVAFEVQDRALTLPRWIYLYDLAEQALQLLELGDLKPLRLSAPACSPDGRYLAFSAYLDGDWELILTELGSGEVLYRFKSSEYPLLGHASWSLSQEAMWWMGTRVNGSYDINQTQGYLAGQAGQIQTFAKGKYPAISPDGSRLAFFCGNLLYLCVAGVPSGEILFQIPVSYFKLVNGLPVPATAAWSSDGQWLYFTSSITGNWDIYRVRADGSQAQNLTETWRSDEFMPAAR